MATVDSSADNRSVVTITTDGATRGNPGPGGWAALLEYGDRERLLEGEHPEVTTNNVMEMVAVAAALEVLKRPCHVVLRCDSTYVLEGLQRLLAGGNLPKKNRAVWERLHEAAARHHLEFTWVKGHAGDARNERVDVAANAAANRAYATAAPQQAPAPDTAFADTWVLALRSAAGSRVAGWALHTPQGIRHGLIGEAGQTRPVDMFHALIAGLQAAQSLPGAAEATLHVISNWELLIKQQRGEWAVKKSEHRPLHMEAMALRPAFADVAFEFQPTDAILAYFPADA
jgi:ribonuclease HI